MTTALYPSSKFSWTDRIDNTDDVMALDTNTLAAESIAIVGDLVGTGVAGGLKQGETSFSVRLGKMLPPVGTIIPFYDYNGALTFDTDYFAYCNGQTKTINGTSRVLPDLSNRYLVGFGTEGGTDNGSAAWATDPVGNASHQINIAHTHTGGGHTHDVDIVGFTSGAGSSHSHGAGTLKFKVGSSDGYYFNFDDGAGNTRALIQKLSETNCLANGTVWNAAYLGQFTGEAWTWNNSGSGSTATEAAHTHAIDPGNTTSTSGGAVATGSGGSSTQTIQPRSVRIRYLMRIK